MLLDKKTVLYGIAIALLLVVISSVSLLYISTLKISLVDEITLQVTPYNQAEFDRTVTPQDEEIAQEVLPGVFSIGLDVQIIGTGGDGLRIRLEPGLEGTPLFLGREGEGFRIIEGPFLRDSIVWWKIESPNDANRSGWAAQDYLKVFN